MGAQQIAGVAGGLHRALVDQRHAAMGQVAEPAADFLQAVHGHRLQGVAEHRFHGVFPALGHFDAVRQARPLVQVVAFQPVADRAVVAHGGFLQGFQGGVAVLVVLQLVAGLVQLAAALAVVPAQLVNLFLQAFGAHFAFFALLLVLGHLLFELAHFPGQRPGVQGLLLLAQALHALAQALNGLLQVLNAGLLHLRLAAGLAGLAVEGFPGLLPLLHGVLGTGQRLRGGLLLLVGLFQARLQGRQPLLQLGELLRVGVLVGVRLFPAGGHLIQLLEQLLAALALVLDALLQARHLGAQRIELLLHLVEAFLGVVVALAQPLDLRVHVALLGNARLHGHFQLGDNLVQLLHLAVQPAPAQRLELGALVALFLFILLVLLGGGRLAAQALDLALQLVADVGEPLQVLAGAAHAVLGLPAPRLVLGDARRFLDIDAQLFRLRLDQPGNHALLDDRVAARAQAGAQEDVGDVLAAALGAVQVVVGLAVPGHLALHGDFVELAVLAGDGAVGVIEHQLNGGLGHRLARIGAVENHVRHGLTAQVLGGGLAHHPAHRVDDVRLAAPVGAHHGGQIFRERGRRRVHEGLEPGQLDCFQSHSARMAAQAAPNPKRPRPGGSPADGSNALV